MRPADATGGGEPFDRRGLSAPVGHRRREIAAQEVAFLSLSHCGGDYRDSGDAGLARAGAGCATFARTAARRLPGGPGAIGADAFFAPPSPAGAADDRSSSITSCPSSALDLVADSALAAIEWVSQHIAEYGGDPRRISLLGHSAGAHLCATGLAADWQARGIDPSFIRGAVLVHRFQSSNHIKRRCRVYRTKYGRQGVG